MSPKVLAFTYRQSGKIIWPLEAVGEFYGVGQKIFYAHPFITVGVIIPGRNIKKKMQDVLSCKAIVLNQRMFDAGGFMVIQF